MAGIINHFVDISSEQVEPKWNNVFQLDSKKDVQVGSEYWNDVLFTGQRIRWMKKPQLGQSVEVSQERSIEELVEIPV